jgi:serine/threonine protein kinase
MSKRGHLIHLPRKFAHFIVLQTHDVTDFSHTYIVCDINTRDRRFVKAIEKLKYSGETAILSMINHRYILKPLEVLKVDSSDVLVFKRLCDGSLRDFISRQQLSPQKVAKLMFQSLLAVDYLHSRNILHGDISLNNLMLDGDSLMLIDFGTAEILRAGEFTANSIATEIFCAPERAKGKSSFPADIYALGITFALLSGDRELSVRSQFLVANDLSICQPLRDLLIGMTRKVPEDRYTARECLKHHFFLETLDTAWMKAELPDSLSDSWSSSLKCGESQSASK